MDLSGIELPTVPAPLAAYTPAVRTGNLVFTSGQLPFVATEEGQQLLHTGRVGAEVTAQEAAETARVACLNALAAVDSIVPLGRVQRVVKLVVFVNSTADFTEQAAVANGASELVQQVFGQAGVHARSAVGVSVLPKNSPTEVEMIVEVKD